MPKARLTIGSVLLIAVVVPIAITGFISTPGEKHTVANEGSTINIQALMKRVLQLNQKKEHQKAIELLLSALDKQKEDSFLRTLLVQTFDLFLEEEIRQGQKDIKKNKRDGSAYNRVAGALELLGDNFRAMEVLLNGLGQNQKAVELWMKVARLELKANRNLEALDVFREVIRLDRKNSDAYNNAAYILARYENCEVKDLKEAEKLAERACKLDPKNPSYIDTLAEVHFRRGHQKQAQTLIEEAIKLAPHKDELKDQLKRFSKESTLHAE